LQKPLRRIEIEEVGFEEDLEKQTAITRAKASQGQMKKNITQKDEQMFEHFIDNPRKHESFVEEHTRQRHAQIITKGTDNSVPKIVEVEKPVDKDTVKEEFKLDLSEENKIKTSKQSKSVSPRTTGSVSPRTSESVSPRSMAVPQTSFQFQADYKILKNNLEHFYQYIKVLLASQLML